MKNYKRNRFYLSSILLVAACFFLQAAQAKAATITVCETDGAGCDFYFYEGDSSITDYEAYRNGLPTAGAGRIEVINAIQAAINEATTAQSFGGGDTVLIKPGTYELYYYLAVNENNDGITISGEDATTTIIDRTNITLAEDVFSTNRVQFLTYNNFTVKGTNTSGIDVPKIFNIGSPEENNESVTIYNVILDCDNGATGDIDVGIALSAKGGTITLYNCNISKRCIQF